jgi:hypothetical protein
MGIIRNPNAFCGQDIGVLEVQPDGTCSNPWALKVINLTVDHMMEGVADIRT